MYTDDLFGIGQDLQHAHARNAIVRVPSRFGAPPNPCTPAIPKFSPMHGPREGWRDVASYRDDSGNDLALSIPSGTFWSLLSVVGVAAGAYHGYKRNESVGWAIGWAILGGIVPIVTLPVSIAQGFGERKKG